jgi:hypothetical protein
MPYHPLTATGAELALREADYAEEGFGKCASVTEHGRRPQSNLSSNKAAQSALTRRVNKAASLRI